MTTGTPRIIAEIGTAHDGDITKARALVGAAADAGAHTAKFQLVIADEILHPLAGSVDLPGGTLPLYDRFRELERDADFYRELQQICRDADVQFLCTPFGLESARILNSLGVDEYKIASPELNHHPLLKEIASYRKPIVLSTGVARLRDIGETVDYIDSLSTRTQIQLLHCVTSYPAKEEEYNLLVIPSLQHVFGLPVGISDHSMDPVLVPALATILGAVTIEKHITLDRADRGLDDPIALNPKEFRTMVREVTDIGTRMSRTADPVDQKRLRLELTDKYRSHYGSTRVDTVLGDGIKRLAPSEIRHYGFTNRSIHAVTDIPAGTLLTAQSLAVLRSEKNLTPGLHPRFWEAILGHRVTRDILAGEGLTWNHLLVD